MKTFEEIAQYYNKHKAEDLLGFTGEVLLAYLPFEHAQPFLIDGAKSEDWPTLPYTSADVIKDMKEYMAFAWDKAQNHRGISAGRSIEKMCAYLWLLDDERTLIFARSDSNYAQYGVPVLKKICEVYGFPIPDGQDILNMAQGKPCRPDCMAGCGR
jgi:hypothetical protein